MNLSYASGSIWVCAVAAAPFLLMAFLGFIPSRWIRSTPWLWGGVSVVLPFAGFVVSLVSLALTMTSGPWSVSLPLFGAFGVGVMLDRLSASLLALVTFVVGIVAAYARSSLRNDPIQPRFLRWFGLTSASVLCLVISGNLVQFVLAWICTSVCLHKLLVLYPNRVSAVLAARKKFIVSRLGDLCLLGALAMIWSRFGTWEFTALFEAARQAHQAGHSAIGAEVHWIGFLLAIGALLKSAQFPFHTWLPDTMETPTPVSALMHAGIINAGGFLILRLNPLITLSGEAMVFLAIVGSFTALFGSVVMLAQSSVKRALAFSTVSQMGFMMLECGVGEFSLAFLHMVGHSLYKAHAFLGAGKAVQETASIQVRGGMSRHLLGWVMLAVVFCAGIMFLGLSRVHPRALVDPGSVMLAGIVSLSLGYALGVHWARYRRAVDWILGGGLAVVLCTLSMGLHMGAERWLGGVAAPWDLPSEMWVWTGVVTMLGLCALVIALQLSFGRGLRSSALEDVYVHARNGFYLNTLANRWVERFWPVWDRSIHWH